DEQIKQQQQQQQQQQESSDAVKVKEGEEVKRQFLQRNVNQATNYFTTQLLSTQMEAASKCSRRNGASRTGPQMARTVSQLFYWQRSSRTGQSAAAAASIRNRHSFKMHVFRKFWNVDRREKERNKKKDDKQVQPKHGQAFCHFHEKWIAENVTKEQCRRSNEMLTVSSVAVQPCCCSELSIHEMADVVDLVGCGFRVVVRRAGRCGLNLNFHFEFLFQLSLWRFRCLGLWQSRGAGANA
ncbi:hypothetical protein D918_00741, partial [Trichuris suis]